MKCPECVKSIDNDSKFCAYCGAKIEAIKEVDDSPSKAQQVFSLALDKMGLWFKSEEDNKEFIKLTKILNQGNGESFLRLLAHSNKDDITAIISELNMDYSIVSRCGFLGYISTYDGYFLYLAKKEIDGERLEAKVENFEDVQKNYDGAVIEDDSEMEKARLGMANWRMTQIEEIDECFANINHKKHQEIYDSLVRSVNTGYAIAEGVWG